MFRKIAVGSQIDSYCGKCKMTLNHIITAMVDSQPKRVRCLTCGSDHNHRAVTSSTPGPSRPTTGGGSSSSSHASRESTAPKTPAAPKASATARWHALVSQWDEGRAKAYSIYQSFGVNDFVTHSTFGRGVVTDTPSPDRMITLFESGEKMLMQGKKRS